MLHIQTLEGTIGQSVTFTSYILGGVQSPPRTATQSNLSLAHTVTSRDQAAWCLS